MLAAKYVINDYPKFYSYQLRFVGQENQSRQKLFLVDAITELSRRDGLFVSYPLKGVQVKTKQFLGLEILKRQLPRERDYRNNRELCN